MDKFLRENLPDPIAFFAAEGIPLTGSGRWRTGPCHFHGGSDSLRVNTQSGGWVCMACTAHGGDVLAYRMISRDENFVQAATALGAWHGNEKGRSQHMIRPRPISANDAIQILSFEAMVIAFAVLNVTHRDLTSSSDRARLILAAQRISHISEIFK